jgi:branched-chain amino acid transport system substrate-binding protein
MKGQMMFQQAAVAMGDWAPKEVIKKVLALVSDYDLGVDAKKYFIERFSSNGGQVTKSLQVPMRNPDFAHFLQKVRGPMPCLYLCSRTWVRRS